MPVGLQSLGLAWEKNRRETNEWKMTAVKLSQSEALRLLTQIVSVVESPVVIVIVPPAVIIAAGDVVGTNGSAILTVSAYY